MITRWVKLSMMTCQRLADSAKAQHQAQLYTSNSHKIRYKLDLDQGRCPKELFMESCFETRTGYGSYNRAPYVTKRYVETSIVGTFHTVW